tara:strand:- start:199 stop:879 length:681 start_codon:yes stop_codon:yes gene_type:complete
MKNIIVTGTSRGIGFQLIKLFSEAGHNVLALSRNSKPVEELELERCTSFPFDITNASDISMVSEFVKKEWQKVDVLIHNSGLLVNAPFSEIDIQTFKKIYDVNVFGVAALTQVMIPFMGKESHVLTISSMGGVQGSVKFPGLSGYSSSKGAVLTLTELLAEEFKESGPSFNALALGAVQTEMLNEAFPGYEAPLTALEMANYIMDFSLNGNKFYNGKILQVSSSTP